MNKILPIGNLKQKASPVLTYFVMLSLVVVVGLFYIMEKSHAISDSFMSVTYYNYVEDSL